METLNKDESDKAESQIITNAAEKEKFFLTGALDELKIVISSGPKVFKECLLLLANALVYGHALLSECLDLMFFCLFDEGGDEIKGTAPFNERESFSRASSSRQQSKNHLLKA